MTVSQLETVSRLKSSCGGPEVHLIYTSLAQWERETDRQGESKRRLWLWRKRRNSLLDVNEAAAVLIPSARWGVRA